MKTRVHGVPAALLLAIGIASQPSCSSDSETSSGETTACREGTPGCRCYGNGTCNPGLVCGSTGICGGAAQGLVAGPPVVPGRAAPLAPVE